MKHTNLFLLLAALQITTILATPLPSENIILSDFQLNPASSNDLTTLSTNNQPDLQLNNGLLGSSSSNGGTLSTFGGQGTISSTFGQSSVEINHPFSSTPEAPAVEEPASLDLQGETPTPTNDETFIKPAPTPGSGHEFFCCSETAQGTTCEGMKDIYTVIKKDGSTARCEAAVFSCPKGLHEFIMKSCPMIQRAPPNGIERFGCQVFGICF